MFLNVEKNNKLKKAATIASVSVAVSLTIMKMAAAFYTGSLAILSSLIDSLADIFASVITFVAVRYSSKPATYGHRYGYGKAESISALVQAAFIAGSGVFVLYDGICRLFEPAKMAELGLGIGVMVVSLAASLVLIAFQKYVAKKTKSLAIEADSAHYTVDVITNISIIITLVLVSWLKYEWIDTVAACAVAGFLLFNAFELAEKAVETLTDAELGPEVRKKVCEIVMAFPFSKGIHDLRTRDLGGAYMFEFHLELDGDLPLSAAHDLTEMVEENVLEAFPNSQIIIHQDPAGHVENRLDARLAKKS